MLRFDDILLKSVLKDSNSNELSSKHYLIDAPSRRLSIPGMVIFDEDEIQDANSYIEEIHNIAQLYCNHNENNMEELENAITEIDQNRNYISMLLDAFSSRLTDAEIEEINMIEFLSNFCHTNKIRSKTIDNLKIKL